MDSAAETRCMTDLECEVGALCHRSRCAAIPPETLGLTDGVGGGAVWAGTDLAPFDGSLSTEPPLLESTVLRETFSGGALLLQIPDDWRTADSMLVRVYRGRAEAGGYVVHGGSIREGEAISKWVVGRVGDRLFSLSETTLDVPLPPWHRALNVHVDVEFLGDGFYGLIRGALADAIIAEAPAPTCDECPDVEHLGEALRILGRAPDVDLDEDGVADAWSFGLFIKATPTTFVGIDPE